MLISHESDDRCSEQIVVINDYGIWPILWCIKIFFFLKLCVFLFNSCVLEGSKEGCLLLQRSLWFVLLWVLSFGWFSNTGCLSDLFIYPSLICRNWNFNLVRNLDDANDGFTVLIENMTFFTTTGKASCLLDDIITFWLSGKKLTTCVCCSYHPIPIVFSQARGSYIWDPEGKKYVDFLAAYSAVNQVWDRKILGVWFLVVIHVSSLSFSNEASC